jgi:hypothetical protein
METINLREILKNVVRGNISLSDQSKSEILEDPNMNLFIQDAMEEACKQLICLGDFKFTRNKTYYAKKINGDWFIDIIQLKSYN